MNHISVLAKEVLEYLHPNSNENFIDGTIGQGGHTKLVLEKNGPEGRVLGIDFDAKQIENSKLALKAFGSRVVLINDSYVNMKEIVAKQQFGPVNGILLDLGYSSWHLESSKRGFSFQKDEPLDMRYSAVGDITAEKIVNEYSQDQIQQMLEEYGEEKFAKQIAKEIVTQRHIKKIESTFELIDIIAKARYGYKSAIPTLAQGQGRGLSIWALAQIGARTFQALRIAVNKELESVLDVLPDAFSLLAPGGRLVVISFHSLEDRIVKNFFRQAEKEQKGIIITKKPVMAHEQEIEINPRSRSAKLRVFIKTRI